jgi:hypothetical protein
VILWQLQAPGVITDWPALAGDSIVWPIGLGRTPILLTLRLGAVGQVPGPGGSAIRTPYPAEATPPVGGTENARALSRATGASIADSKNQPDVNVHGRLISYFWNKLFYFSL